MAFIEKFLQAIWLLPLLLFAVYVGNQTRKYYRLRQFKGPYSTGWCEIPHIYAMVTFRSHLWYQEVTDRYGSIARIGPNDLITSSPELLMHMSAVRSPYSRAAWYNRSARIEPGRDHIFSQVDEEKHTKRRQQMAAGYSGKENTDLESTIDRYIDQYTSLIRHKYRSTPAQHKVMDLARKTQYLTLDVISDIGFGQAFGDLANDADMDSYLESTDKVMASLSIICASGVLRFLQWPPVARFVGPNEKSESGFGKVMATARRLIDERLQAETRSKSDMLAAFMRHGLTREDLFTEAWLQIIAGSETTATAIRGTMLYLMSNPRVYVKLQREIDGTVAAGLAPGIVPDVVARDLVYLQAVLREGFRMRPPVTDIVPKTVPKGGDTLVVEGKTVFLPGGTHVGYSVNGLNRRKDIFGEDAELFRPERWIPDGSSESIDRVAEMKKTTELIFGYGKYQCLGKNIAWMEYSKAIFELLRHFDFALAKPQDIAMERNHIGIFKANKQWVIVTGREQGD
ncbi:cytochrome P450 [Karstenula rhodostoma CBS 690.94]|uniref:Cytochrome P450 monooxygenase ABA1 n=1 Tax=Karstenula rhodostoma CBS 690.94 TaxID=1392251 RepID=A0A9P4PPW8_9PLEO|nr:cytochrome P450 [Karstenula rhodostoma CBS 690.94]